MIEVYYIDFKIKNEDIVKENKSLKVIIELFIENKHQMDKIKIGITDDSVKIEKYIYELLKSDFPNCISISYRIISLITNELQTGKFANL